MAQQEEYKVEYDALAVGLARPPLFCGVMLQVAVSNMLLCTLAYVYLQTIYVVPLFAFMHLVAMRLSVKEPRFLQIYTQVVTKIPPIMNTVFWGRCNTYSPF